MEGTTMDGKSQDALITIDEICDTLMIGRNTAYKLLKDGDIKAFKIGRIWKIPKKALSQYVNSHI